MSRGMVSFLAGMGTGYIKAKDKAYEQERQAKIDARADWEHNQKVDAANKQAKVDQDLIDAAAPRQAVSGEVIEAGGQKLFSADPGQAAQVKSMVDSIAELEGAAPAVQQPGYAVTGSMARGHQIGAGAAPDVAALNTPDAESQRVQDVYRRSGMRDKAMQEFTANEAYKKAISERMTKMETEGVTTALSLLKAGAPEQAMEAFQKSGSVKLPEGSKFVQVDGTNMWTGQPGKVWSAVGPDGKTIVADVGQVTAKYLGLDGIIKQEADLAKNKQTQSNSDRDHKLKEKEVGAKVAYYGGLGGGAAPSIGKPPSGYRLAQSGDRLEPIPGGPADKPPASAKPMPATALKMQNEALDVIGIASSVQADLGAIEKQISDGKLSFGPVSNITNNLRNLAGNSSEESRNFSTFKSSLEKLRNDSLRLNKGVQTDGDAQRAWNELFQNINDTKLVSQRLAEIKQINARAVDLQKRFVEDIRNNFGQEPYDFTVQTNVPAAVAQSGKAKTGAYGLPVYTSASDIAQLPSGSLYINAEGKTKRKP